MLSLSIHTDKKKTCFSSDRINFLLLQHLWPLTLTLYRYNNLYNKTIIKIIKVVLISMVRGPSPNLKLIWWKLYCHHFWIVYYFNNSSFSFEFTVFLVIHKTLTLYGKFCYKFDELFHHLHNIWSPYVPSPSCLSSRNHLEKLIKYWMGAGGLCEFRANNTEAERASAASLLCRSSVRLFLVSDGGW